MGYDIHLNDPVTKQIIELENPHFMRGGTYAIDGTKELSLNITYNYAVYSAVPMFLVKKASEAFTGKPELRAYPFCKWQLMP